MPSMLVTFAVLKLLRSRLVKAVHTPNIFFIFCTFFVSKWLTSRFDKLLQL